MLRSSSICASFLYNYLTTDSEIDDKEHKNIKDDKKKQWMKKCKKVQCLSKTFESYGGVLSKLSQILSLDNKNSSVYSDCKPFSKKETIKFFKTFIETSNFQLDDVDFNVYKSGSVGQVHKATYKNQNIIFKVQYVGLAKQTLDDLYMLDKITSYLYHFADMKKAMIDIKTTMNEELDYRIEASNQQLMYELYKDNSNIEIPTIIPELCTENVLSMNFVHGRSLSEFIDNSTQDERNTFGLCLVQFVFENIYKHGILYSDVHYGNFLVKDDFTLCVLDFGCIHKINTELLNNMRNLHISIKNNDRYSFYKLVENMGIIKDTISDESKDYIYDYFKIQYTPWISEDFQFTDEWLDLSTDKETNLMNEWILPQDMVYFNKIPYGAYHIFTKLKLQGNFSELFDTIFNSF